MIYFGLLVCVKAQSAKISQKVVKFKILVYIYVLPSFNCFNNMNENSNNAMSAIISVV